MKTQRAPVAAMWVTLFAAVPVGTVLAQAQEAPETSGFLSDYSKLKPTGDNTFDQFYVSPGVQEHARRYTAVMVDQPEIFVDPDSKYNGIKPDDMKLIADGLREAVTRELQGSYDIVDQPGPNVLLVRLAVSDLMLQKHKRPLLAYTPVGAVVHATRKALTSDVTKKIDLKGMRVEGEVLDSKTLEQYGAMTTSRGSIRSENKNDPVSWNDLEGAFTVVGKRLRCRLDNGRLPAAEQQQCEAIGLAPATSAGLESDPKKG